MPGHQPHAPQAPGLPGQPQPGGQNGQQAPTEAERVLAVIREEAQRAAQASIMPQLEAQERARRRSEGLSLVEDYPDLKDATKAHELVGRARQWAADLGIPQMAGEPGFVELVHLAGMQIAAAQQAMPAAPGGVPPAQQQPGVTLETPGGTPPPPAPGNDAAARIVAAGRGGLSPLWGGKG
jgi:hypothetical protein